MARFSAELPALQATSNLSRQKRDEADREIRAMFDEITAMSGVSLAGRVNGALQNVSAELAAGFNTLLRELDTLAANIDIAAQRISASDDDEAMGLTGAGQFDQGMVNQTNTVSAALKA